MRKRTKKVSKINKFVRDNSQIENLNQFQSKIPNCSTFKIAEERLSLKLWDDSQLESLKHMQNAWKLEHSFELPALGEICRRKLIEQLLRSLNSEVQGLKSACSQGLEDRSLKFAAWSSKLAVQRLKFKVSSRFLEKEATFRKLNEAEPEWLVNLAVSKLEQN